MNPSRNNPTRPVRRHPRSTPFLRFGMALTAVLLCSVLLAPTASWAKSWTGLGDGSDWHDGNNWTPTGVPALGESVTVAADADILLAAETAELAAFTMTGGTLTFTNWMTRLRATGVDLQGGKLTLPGPFTESQMSNRVWIVCGDFTLNENAVIDVSGRGYRSGNGLGKGGVHSGGAHGGPGGRGASPEVVPQSYGSVDEPVAPGSGGSYDATNTPEQSAGGGAVRIDATGTVTLDGAILADGADGRRFGGGGSGGSVYITSTTFGGAATGLISVQGSDCPPWAGWQYFGGTGAGGRIAVAYDQLDGTPGVRFTATPGAVGHAEANAYGLRHHAGWGTLHLPDLALFSTVLTNDQFREVNVYVGGAQSWTVQSLTIENAALTFAEPGFRLTVETDCRIDGGALGLHGELVTLGGDLSVTNGGALHVFSDATGGVVTDYGARVSVTGELRVASGSWIIPFAHETDGGTVLIEAQNVRIAAGGGVNADGGGYASQTGPGKGAGANGAGYGGRGGGSAGGSAYGQISAGTQPGSGGGHVVQGGYGGGCVRIVAAGTVTVDGIISANGLGTYGTGGSGGSGGGIDIRCAILEGAATGLLQTRSGGGILHANGSWYGYPGSGGRIALGYATLATGFATRVDAGYPAGAQLNDPVAMRPYRPEWGTLWAPDAALMSDDLSGQRFRDVQLFLDGMTAWNADNLALGDSAFVFGPADFILTVTNALSIGNGGHLGVRGDILVQVGNLALDAGAALSLYAAATSGLGRAYGSLVDVGGILSVASNAWIYPYAHPTDGGSVLFRPASLTVAEGGGFDADGLGFQWAAGPGRGKHDRAGGGYGGRGGDQGTRIGGDTYGVAFAPTLPGSGGGGPAWGAGFGGGLVWIEASGTAQLDGQILARGMRALTTGGGGGAGGGILLSAHSLKAGAAALLSVDGGEAIKHPASPLPPPDNWYTAGGGGGRIALWREVPPATGALLIAGVAVSGIDPDAEPFLHFEGTTSAEGGPGYEYGDPGTIRFVDGRPRATFIMIH